MSPALPRATASQQVKWVLRSLAIALGALHTAVAMRSQSMNEDGIAYLDFGDALWNGSSNGATNTTWSPLYAWILGGVLKIVQPSMSWEFPTVQLVNLTIYLIALASFEFFWRRLGQTRLLSPGDGRDRTPIPTFWWLVAGYSLFIYVSLNLISVWSVTPDMCVAALVYVAAGLLIDVGSSRSGRLVALALGAVLGVAYLAKAAMLPLGLACIALVALLPRPGRRSGGHAVLAVLAFLVVAAPWSVALSKWVGHATFSDVGRFTYLKHVNQMPWPQWQLAAGELDGVPAHPPRLAHDDPAVWEFGDPIGGTYPLGYDPAWWAQGLEPRVEPAQQAAVLAGNLQYYFHLFVRMQGGVLAAAVLLLLSTLYYERRVRWDASAALVLWGGTALGLYSLVFAEARYVAAFVLLVWGGLLAKVALPPGAVARRMTSLATAVLSLFVWINIGALNLEGLAGVAGFQPAPREMSGGAHGRSLADRDTARHPVIASELVNFGLRKNDPIAFIGYSYSAYWARLVRLRIVAEIRPEQAAEFWRLDALRQRDVLDSLRQAGARAVVAEPPQPGMDMTGWKALPAGYLVRRLD
jgi:hypothetical protein